MKYHMTVKNIFWSGLLIGLLTAIAIMYLLNGILGHASMKEGISAFILFQGAAAIGLIRIWKRLNYIWHVSVRFPDRNAELMKGD